MIFGDAMVALAPLPLKKLSFYTTGDKSKVASQSNIHKTQVTTVSSREQ